MFATNNESGIYDAAIGHAFARDDHASVTITFCDHEQVLEAIRSYLDSLATSQSPLDLRFLLSGDLVTDEVLSLLAECKKKQGITSAFIEPTAYHTMASAILSGLTEPYNREEMVLSIANATHRTQVKMINNV